LVWGSGGLFLRFQNFSIKDKSSDQKLICETTAKG
jgi:hypothetical protein